MTCRSGMVLRAYQRFSAFSLAEKEIYSEETPQISSTLWEDSARVAIIADGVGQTRHYQSRESRNLRLRQRIRS